MIRKIKHLLLPCLLVLILGVNCQKQKATTTNSRQITDLANRSVLVPDTVQRVVCIRPGAVHLVTMAGGFDFISGIENNETGKANFTHTLAYPQIKEDRKSGV